MNELCMPTLAYHDFDSVACRRSYKVQVVFSVIVSFGGESAAQAILLLQGSYVATNIMLAN